jgi:glycylpeptide N-tetradecanoyltransferase
MSSSSQTAPNQDTRDTAQEGDQEDNFSGSDHGRADGDATPKAPQASSSKRKKKKSKVAKVLNTLRGNEIPQTLVDQVVEEATAEQGANAPAIDAETVRQALEQMKVMDVLKGKAGVAGREKKSMGEHKVRSSICCMSVHELTYSNSSG